MAHWAKIDENGIVENVVVTSNDEVDEGESWLIENLGGTWLKTSYNTYMGKHLLGGEPFRKNFAGVGYTYDAELDAFIPPKAEGEEDFILNEETATWIPAPFPEDAYWVINYGPEPECEFEEKTFQDEDGNDVVALVPILPEGAKIYVWDADAKQWVAPAPPTE